MELRLPKRYRTGLALGFVVVITACGSAKPSAVVIEVDNAVITTAPARPAVLTPIALEKKTTTTTIVRSTSSLGLRVEAEYVGGYKRNLFANWYDADRDGCDTRQEVLIAESIIPAKIGAKCKVTGQWFSIYDDVTTTNSSSFDIDHMVPLKEAWDSGAWNWNTDQRKKFANDLDESFFLIAVTASSNRSKGEKDPAEWMPTSVSYRCEYARIWVSIKRSWDLSVDPAENTFLTRTLASC
jgi:hypothetical protein